MWRGSLLVLALAAACARPAVEPAAPTDAATAAPTAEPAGWRAIPAGPLAARHGHVAVWTGDRMVVWGGLSSSSGGDLDDGAAYDPRNRTWRTIARAPLPSTGGTIATWTGREVLVLAGDRGAAYDPDADRWRTIAAPPLEPRDDPAWAWTGERLIVWGGGRWDPPEDGPVCGCRFFADGASYDPVADRWTPLPDSPIAARQAPAAAWTGDRFIVWGGGTTPPDEEIHESFLTNMLRDGASFDPEAQRWRTISGGPPSRDPAYGAYSVTWTGDRMAVWFGFARRDEPAEPVGASYDPAGDRWTEMTPPPLSEYRYDQTTVWSGDRMLVWGGIIGEGGNHRWNDGAAYDPRADTWSALPASPLSPRSGHSAVWTGTQMLVWGGYAEERDADGTVHRDGPVADGAALTP